MPFNSSLSLGRSIVELLASAGQPLSRSEVRRRLGLTESHLSHLLRGLESAGLVTRVRPAQGREVLVDLGPEGRKTAEAAKLPRWVDRLSELIAQAGEGIAHDSAELVDSLLEAGIPSRAAADRLAAAVTGLGERAPRSARPSAWEVREPSLAESGGFAGAALLPWIEAAAAAQGQSVRDYCRKAVEERLAAEGLLPGSGPRTAAEAAQVLDRLRRKVGPIGVAVRELVDEGRRR